LSQLLSVPAELLDGFLQFVEVSSLTTKRAMDEVVVHRQAQEKAAALQAQLLEHMIRSNVVNASQKEAAAVMLGAHDTSLQLLKASVDRIAELHAALVQAKGGFKQAGDLGQGVDASSVGTAAGGSYEHQGEYNSLTHPIVGEKSAFVKESDKPLRRLIGK